MCEHRGRVGVYSRKGEQVGLDSTFSKNIFGEIKGAT